jgi:CheY-like chemotaxis protein
MTAKILVVDDDVKNVKLLEAQLLPQGYQILKAYDGAQALRQVQQERPDLILLDVMMPVMDGFEVCKRLKDDMETRFIPVVIMTALGATADRVKGIEAGADDFLTKPVQVDELMARIRTSLRLKQAVDHKLIELRQLSKFVPETARRLIAANPHAPALAKQPRDVSVLFLDLIGYTRLNEMYDPQAVDTLVQAYFSAFLDIIDEAGGDITETSGDGLMVIFQDPAPQRRAVIAVDTALALFAKTAELNVTNRLEPVALHMGLNSGTALVGSTRFEGQRGTRWVFTADGAVINLAARLVGIAEAGQILLGPEAAERLQGRYPLQRLGPTWLKNIPAPIDVHCLRYVENELG